MSSISAILFVEDVDSSMAFYTEKLGFQPGTTLSGPSGKATFGNAYYGDSMIMFNGWYPTTAAEQRREREANVEVQLDVPEHGDIDTLYAKACARGVTVTQEIKDEFCGDRTFCLTDPDGYNLRFTKTVSTVMTEAMAEVTKRGA